MSEWRVHLTFEEGSSSKFWRARVDGNTLYVNFGRIGSAGQTQIKQLASAAVAEKELEKLAESKRKKGYEDAEAEGEEEEERDEEEGGEEEEEGGEEEEEDGGEEDGEEEEEEKPRPKKVAGPAIEHVDLALRSDGRKVDLRFTRQGASIRTVVVETYDSPDEARSALERLTENMLGEGYKKVPTRETL
jgi:predicted DNA-binding WGR domain protein